jgi:hypothetical protein
MEKIIVYIIQYFIILFYNFNDFIFLHLHQMHILYKLFFILKYLIPCAIFIIPLDFIDLNQPSILFDCPYLKEYPFFLRFY